MRATSERSRKAWQFHPQETLRSSINVNPYFTKRFMILGVPWVTTVQKPWNESIPQRKYQRTMVSTMASKWCEMDFVHPQYCTAKRFMIVYDSGGAAPWVGGNQATLGPKRPPIHTLLGWIVWGQHELQANGPMRIPIWFKPNLRGLPKLCSGCFSALGRFLRVGGFLWASEKEKAQLVSPVSPPTPYLNPQNSLKNGFDPQNYGVISHFYG